MRASLFDFPKTLLGSNKNIFKGVYSVKDFNQIKILDLKKIEKFKGSLFGIFKFLDLNTIKISKFSNYIKTRPVSFEKNNYYRKL